MLFRVLINAYGSLRIMFKRPYYKGVVILTRTLCIQIDARVMRIYHAVYYSDSRMCVNSQLPWP